MSYHNEMMNIPTSQSVEDWAVSPKVNYKEGHRDARHAAAEIAIKADARIAELEAENAKLRAALAERDAQVTEKLRGVAFY